MPIPVYLQDYSKVIGEGSPDPDLAEGIRKLYKRRYRMSVALDAISA
jgi:hypothetical protein